MNQSEKMVTITFQPFGRRVKVRPGVNLLDAAISSGISIRSICGGKGNCGKCKVIIKKGSVDFIYNPKEKLLTEEELKAGYVLACLSLVNSDCEIFIPPESRLEGQRILSDALVPEVELDPLVGKIYLPADKISSILHKPGDLGIPLEMVKEAVEKSPECGSQGVSLAYRRWDSNVELLDFECSNTVDENYGLAVDIGTTKIVAYLVNLNNGKIIGKASDYNRQLIYGEDIVSRVGYTLEKEDGAKAVQRAAVETINDLISRLMAEHGISWRNIYDVVAGGNTVMTYLFAGINAQPLLDPGTRVPTDPVTIDAAVIDLKVNEKAKVYLLPSAGRFLGGDAIGDILASGIFKEDDICIIIDIGTNVEAIMGNKEWFIATTAAAGPAFEGWGIRFGIRAVEGAIDSVKIDPETLKAKYTVIGGGKPKGICGSGLIDTLSELFTNGIVDRLGKINREITSEYIREGEDGYEYVVVPAEETEIGRDIVITEKDIANLIDSKAAACAAVGVLLKKMNLTVYDVKKIFICGAFGSYLNLNSAIAIGLIPEFPNAEVKYIGNGSVAGAYLSLVSKSYRKIAEDVARNIAYIDLLKDSDFMDEYTAAYFLPGKKELFPTWWEASRKIRNKTAMMGSH